MLESKELISLGKRIEELNNFINNPQDLWILNNILPKFEQMLKTGFPEELEPKGIEELNYSIDSYQYRFDKIFDCIVLCCSIFFFNEIYFILYNYYMF